MALNTYNNPIDPSITDMAYNGNYTSQNGNNVGLERVVVDKEVGKTAMQKWLLENQAVNIRPSTGFLYPEKTKQVKEDAAKSSFFNTLLSGLGSGMAAYAEGMGAGTPYSNAVKIKLAEQEKATAAAKAQEDLRRWQIETGMKAKELGIKVNESENKAAMRAKFSGMTKGATPPEGFMIDPNYAIGASDKPFIPDPAFKSTDTQKTTAIYAKRLADSESVFKNLEGYINNLGILDAAGGMMPPTMAVLKGDKLQQYEQAKRSFVNAVLRKESGAVINQDEFDNANAQYFPMYGDTKATIEQKRKNRESVIAGFTSSSGSALNKLEKESAKRNSSSNKLSVDNLFEGL